MSYTKQQLEKLPKWAQLEIKRLSHYTQILEERVKQINGESETNTYLCDGLESHPMAKGSRIEFCTGERNHNKVNVYVKENGLIDINCDSRAGRQMVILPNAANSFYIKFID